MKIAVCEDNVLTANRLSDMLLKHEKSVEIFSNGQKLIDFLIKTKERFSIIFMDIEMPELNGIETAKEIRRFDSEVLIVFVTDYKEYVYDVFEVLPFHFLQKSVSEEMLAKTINRAKEHLSTIAQIHQFSISGENFAVPYKEIRYFESQGRKIILRGRERDYEYYGKFSLLMGQLNPDVFVQSHFSYIVNMEYVFSLKGSSLVLSDLQSVPISRKYAFELKRKHIDFLERRT